MESSTTRTTEARYLFGRLLHHRRGRRGPAGLRRIAPPPCHSRVRGWRTHSRHRREAGDRPGSRSISYRRVARGSACRSARSSAIVVRALWPFPIRRRSASAARRAASNSGSTRRSVSSISCRRYNSLSLGADVRWDATGGTGSRVIAPGLNYFTPVSKGPGRGHFGQRGLLQPAHGQPELWRGANGPRRGFAGRPRARARGCAAWADGSSRPGISITICAMAGSRSCSGSAIRGWWARLRDPRW